MQHGEVMKSKQIIKSISFSNNKEWEKKILDYVERMNLDFAKETKIMWLSRTGITPQARISILKERLNNENLSRSQKFRIRKEIKHIIETEIKEIEGSLNGNN